MDKLKYIPGDLCIVKGKIESVCEVDRDNDFSITTDQHPFIRLSEVKPIPLTPEILEKNGWKFYHGFYCSPNEKGAGISLSSQAGYVWNAYIAGHTLRSDINSVSDLQHLLFGLGINYEMEV